MKYKVTRFRSLAAALKHLEQFIRNGRHLLTGKPFNRMGLRPREVLGNFLLCAVGNHEAGGDERFTFSSDPVGGDGIIRDALSESTWQVENVIVPSAAPNDAANGDTQILKAIENKRGKGKAYATGKVLLVFLHAPNLEWQPCRVTSALPEPLHFAQVWVCGLFSEEQYVYSVTLLEDVGGGRAPTWVVRVENDFASWTVGRFNQVHPD